MPPHAHYIDGVVGMVRRLLPSCSQLIGLCNSKLWNFRGILYYMAASFLYDFEENEISHFEIGIRP